MLYIFAVAAVVELKTASLRVPWQHSTAVSTPDTTAAVLGPLQCDAQEKVRKRDTLLIMDRLHCRMLTSKVALRKPSRPHYVKGIYLMTEPLNKTTLNIYTKWQVRTPNRPRYVKGIIFITLRQNLWLKPLEILTQNGKSEHQTDHAMWSLKGYTPYDRTPE